MSDKINDVTPAFPMPGMTGLPNGDFIYGYDGMRLRDYFVAHAPAEEIEAIIPATLKDISEWLEVDKYDYSVHYPIALAKARHIWADAMLRAREVKP